MDEFLSIGNAAMSSDETPKIEPTLTDAPSIAPEARPEPAEAAAPKTEESPKLEAPAETKAETKAEPEKIEPKTEPRIEPRIEKAAAPTLPPAAQIAEPGKAIVAFRRPETKAEKAAPAQSRSTRFALLAACVAIAASFGAIGGSLGVAKFGPMMSPPPQTVSVAKEHTADEIKALKETVAQLRANTKSLNDNLAALKTSMTASNSAQNTQIGKIAETLERVEKSQAEQRKTVAAAPTMTSTTQAVASPETTGSIQQKAPVPMVLGSPPTTLKPPILQGWVLRRVYNGAALIESRDGIIEVEPGSVVPGLGRVEDIKRQDGRWVMMTSRGLVVGR
jgi:hypothetical protein